MRRHPLTNLDGEIAERWKDAAAETNRLLEENQALRRKREELADARIMLLRDVLAEARRMVDEAEPIVRRL